MAALLPRFDLSINYIVAGRLQTNVLHYSAPVQPPTFQQNQNAADALSNRFATVYRPTLSNVNRFEGVELRYISAGSGRYSVSTAGAGVGGQGAGTSLDIPAADTVIIQLLGDGPPKRANGSIYVGGVTELNVTGGRLNNLGLEAYQTIGLRAGDPMSTTGAEGFLHVLSRKDNTMYLCLAANVRDVLGHLRRRRPR